MCQYPHAWHLHPILGTLTDISVCAFIYTFVAEWRLGHCSCMSGTNQTTGKPGVSALFDHRTALAAWGRRTWVYRNPAGTLSPGTLVCTYAPLPLPTNLWKTRVLDQLQFPGSTDTREGFALSTMFPRLALISTFIIRTSMLYVTRSSTCASTLSVYASMCSLSICASTSSVYASMFSLSI